MMFPEPSTIHPEVRNGHKSGDKFMQLDGTKYEVAENGAWIRVTPKKHLPPLPKNKQWRGTKL